MARLLKFSCRCPPQTGKKILAHRGGKALFAAYRGGFFWKKRSVMGYHDVFSFRADPEREKSRFILETAFTEYLSGPGCVLFLSLLVEDKNNQRWCRWHRKAEASVLPGKARAKIKRHTGIYGNPLADQKMPECRMPPVKNGNSGRIGEKGTRHVSCNTLQGVRSVLFYATEGCLGKHCLWRARYENRFSCVLCGARRAVSKIKYAWRNTFAGRTNDQKAGATSGQRTGEGSVVKVLLRSVIRFTLCVIERPEAAGEKERRAAARFRF